MVGVEPCQRLRPTRRDCILFFLVNLFGCHTLNASTLSARQIKAPVLIIRMVLPTRILTTDLTQTRLHLIRHHRQISIHRAQVASITDLHLLAAQRHPMALTRIIRLGLTTRAHPKTTVVVAPQCATVANLAIRKQ